MAPPDASVATVSPAEALDLLGGGLDDQDVGVMAGRPFLAVRIDDSPDLAAVATLVDRTPCVVAGVAPSSADAAALDALEDVARAFDLALVDADPDPRPARRPWVTCGGDADGEVARLSAVATTAPEAAVVLMQVLRESEGLTTQAGLLAESLAYSTLQSGRAFASWLEGRSPRAHAADAEPAVLCERDDDELTITLNRPHVHNALDTAMREALVEALRLAVADPSIARVRIRGAGSTFSSGGDLTEFGSFPDPSTAHIVRTTRHPARWIAQVADRTTVEVHGTCVGAGVELSAFAHRVVAHPLTTFRLPEVAMGLIPGAGGTVSVPRRIGRHRAAWLALANRPIDAGRAMEWGLIDEISVER